MWCYYTFVPEDPAFKPTDEAKERSLELLKSLAPDAQEVRNPLSEEIQCIIGPGSFDTVLCPFCGTNIDKWTIDQFDRSYQESRFRDLSIVTPCCAKPTTLRELNYSPQPIGRGVGFARFRLEVVNSNLVHALSPDALPRLEEAVGCRLIPIIVWL
jgi:hypothetical protein